ncbi:MAG: WecB/TagA/CpsF family glycosyltransferase [Gemmiger sp.]
MQTVSIFGVNYCAATRAELEAAIMAPLAPGECRTAAFAPMTSLSQAAREEEYRAVLNGMSFCAMDGKPVVGRARRLHPELGEIERCSGPDVTADLLEATAAAGARHYFYGTSAENLAALRAALEQRCPGICICGTEAPPFRPLTPEEDAAAVARIRAAKPDYLWVALGAPRQDFWVAQHAAALPGMRVMSVGAALKFLSGQVERAPLWMQKAGLEWLWRILREPRQAGRYLKNGVYFAGRCIRADILKKDR